METKIEDRLNHFSDTKNRKWVLKMTVGKVRQIRETLGVDITHAIDPTKSVVDDIANDPVLMFDIIYLCCLEQMESTKVSGEDLADAISGDTIEDAAKALIDAIIDFFPRSKTEVIRESLALKDKMVMRIKRKSLDSMKNLSDDELDQAVVKMAQELGKQSTPVPESSA